MTSGPAGGRFWGWVFVLMGAGYLGAPAWRRWRSKHRYIGMIHRQPDSLLATSSQPLAFLRQVMLRSGGGVFVGLGASGREWLTANPQQAVMVLGPPRSGKTSSVVVPALLSAQGAVVSTSTKLDVLQATASCRSVRGRIWLFDPSGAEATPHGVERLRWTPVDQRASWDDSLTITRAMVDAAKPGSGGDNEYWNERAGSLLAGLMHAAAVSGRGIRDVRAWVLREEIDLPIAALEMHDEPLATDVLEGVARTSDHTRSSIFSTASSVLSAYNSAAALGNCDEPNFDPVAFVDSADTVYITAPGHLQTRLAPLVVGLLEQIRNAAYARARKRVHPSTEPPVLWALDEVANIAPLNSLPAVVSEGGGQGLQVMVCLQDLSQARGRWGPAADGFLSLFGVKIVFGGIGDLPTLQALSAFVGTCYRAYTAVQTSTSRTRSLRDTSRTRGSSTTTSVQREAILTEGDIATMPSGEALMLGAGEWRYLRAEPYFSSPCWRNVLAHAPAETIGS